MEIIRKEEIASVTLFLAKLSEDEVTTCESVLNYVLATLEERTIEAQFGASKEELEGLRDDLRHAMKGRGQVEKELEPVAS